MLLWLSRRRSDYAVIVSLRLLCLFVLIYQGWIIFRVVDGWLGFIPACLAILFLPITGFLMPFLMLIIPSTEAGALALWPGALLIGSAMWLAEKRGKSLLIKV